MFIRDFFKDPKFFIKRYRRKFFESRGLDHYSRPALQEVDRKLEKYLNFSGGFFIEAGANDGFSQSNTYYFEKFLNWSGILIEPIPELYKKCIFERPNSQVINCALVSEDYPKDTIALMYSNLMSLVKGARKNNLEDFNHVNKGLDIQALKSTYEIDVPAKTLTSVLKDCAVGKIDLFSLDVEGYELDVLRGFDMLIYRPKYILVEVNFPDEINKYLNSYNYHAIDELTSFDILYIDEN